MLLNATANFALNATTMELPAWTWSLLYGMTYLYIAIEIGFYFVCRFYLIPRANQRTDPPPFRAFGCHDGKDRFMLLRRILDRLERRCNANGDDFLQATAEYLVNWFRFEPAKAAKGSHPAPPPMRRVCGRSSNGQACSRSNSAISGSESESEFSDDTEDDDEWEALPSTGDGLYVDDNGEIVLTNSKHDGCLKTNIFKWALGTLCYDDVQDLLSCFFFGKDVDRLLEWEVVELKRMFDYLETYFDLKCKPGRSGCCTPRLLVLENVTVWHRPLAVYAAVQAFQWAKGVFLYMLGFQRHTSTTGLQYWYRPATKASAPPPLLFFHGIAPGGAAIYIPMLLWGVAGDGRALFIFENKPISCHPSFDVVTEDETIEGVQEALEKFHFDGDISLMGHSFGSFQLTWLLYSPLRNRIRQFALLDPVSMLLSEPDLLYNFENAPLFFQFILKELWTNFYVRRHFSWYRCELWLDDLPTENIDIFVGLGGGDQLINGTKVKADLEIFAADEPALAEETTIAFWPKALHGDCLYQPSKWKDIRSFFDKCNVRAATTAAAATTNPTAVSAAKEKVC